MDCMYPQFAVKINGKYKFMGSVYRTDLAKRKYLYDISGDVVYLPCGQCMACRLNKSRDWATRCVLEAKMHKDNCFVTLTYKDLHHFGQYKELNHPDASQICKYDNEADYITLHTHQRHNT